MSGKFCHFDAIEIFNSIFFKLDVQLLLNSTRLEPEHAQHFNFWDEGGRWGERGVRGEWGDHPRW